MLRDQHIYNNATLKDLKIEIIKSGEKKFDKSRITLKKIKEGFGKVNEKEGVKENMNHQKSRTSTF